MTSLAVLLLLRRGNVRHGVLGQGWCRTVRRKKKTLHIWLHVSPRHTLLWLMWTLKESTYTGFPLPLTVTERLRPSCASSLGLELQKLNIPPPSCVPTHQLSCSFHPRLCWLTIYAVANKRNLVTWRSDTWSPEAQYQLWRANATWEWANDGTQKT